MRQSLAIVATAVACLVLIPAAGHADIRKPARTDEPARAVAAKDTNGRDRSRLFAADTRVVASTATVASHGQKPGCGTIACRNYTLMGVGF